jgi:hypothetical protein
VVNALPPRKRLVPNVQEDRRAHGRYGSVRKISLPSVFDPWTVHHITSRYTDDAILRYVLVHIPCDADYNTNSWQAGNVHKTVSNQNRSLFPIVHSSFLPVFQYCVVLVQYFIFGRTSFFPICDSKPYTQLRETQL